jgi:hypothetical protein
MNIPTPSTEGDLAVERQRSSRRRWAIAAAALIVCVLPTACDYASAAEPTEPTSSASGYGNHGVNNGDDGGGTTKGNTAGNGNGNGGASGGHNHGGTTAPTTTPVDDPTTTPVDDPTTTPVGDQGGDQGGDTTDPTTAPPTTTSTAPGTGTGGDQGKPPDNGLAVLGRDCSTSDLDPHTGFQIAPACVSTAFGEVAAEDKDPTLLITDSPQQVAVNTPFTIKVSTRNLVRDRFLGAAAGGYYLESSFLTKDGLQRGHFHTACRMLESLTEAPQPAPVPAFFLATQDNGGGSTPDTVTISVTGMPTKGTAQCTVWAGDGSHRTPMMQRANQTPAVDSVRITVE